MIRLALRLAVVIIVLVVAAPQWLPLPGRLLVVDESPTQADVALVLDGVGIGALEGAEAWRRSGLVREVVLVEAPVKTHALTTYWSDLVKQGQAPAAPTPTEHLRVVRAASGQPADQARAALPALRELGAKTVMAPGGGIGSRLMQRELARVLEADGVQVKLARMAPPRYDAGRWYEAAEGRRAVLDLWLQLLVPYLAGSSADGLG